MALVEKNGNTVHSIASEAFEVRPHIRDKPFPWDFKIFIRCARGR